MNDLPDMYSKGKVEEQRQFLEKLVSNENENIAKNDDIYREALNNHSISIHEVTSSLKQP